MRHKIGEQAIERVELVGLSAEVSGKYQSSARAAPAAKASRPPWGMASAACQMHMRLGRTTRCGRQARLRGAEVQGLVGPQPATSRSKPSGASAIRLLRWWQTEIQHMFAR